MSLSNSIIKSTSLLFLTRFINKGIGLISTLILARLLTPEDYGMVAIATLVVYLFDELSNTGTREYIIHKKQLDNDVLNTAWTLNLVVKVIVWVLFLLLIPIVTEFYSKPGLTEALFVISLILPICALKNVGVVIFEKELNYTPLFYLELSQKAIAFVFIVSIALWLENYWAMIIGTVISYTVLVAGSYVVHDYRPKLALSELKEQWDFSKWMLPRGLLGFSKAEFDVFIVSKTFDIHVLGGFNLMKSLINMLGRDVIMPATEPLLATFSKTKHDFDKLSFQLVLSLFVILAFSLPIMIFIGMFHKEIVLILLGEQWVSYSAVLGVLSIMIVTFSVGGLLQHMLTSLGKIKIQFYYEIFGLAFTVLTLLTINFDSLFEFSFVRSLLAIVLIMVLFVYVKKIVKLPAKYLLSLLLPIILSLVLAYVTISNIDVNDELPLILALSINGLCFFITYMASSVLLLFFYRDRGEVIYLRWLAGQVFIAVRNKLKQRSSRDG